MTQDQPQTPESNQPQPTESPAEPSTKSPDDAGLTDAGLSDASPTDTSPTDASLTEVSLTEVSSTDASPEENQLQSTDSLPEASPAAAQDSTTEDSSTQDSSTDAVSEEQPIETPAEAPAETSAETSAAAPIAAPVPVSAAASSPPVSKAEDTVSPDTVSSPASPGPEATPKVSPKATPETTSETTSRSKVATFFRLIGQLWGIVLPLLVIAVRWAWQVILITLKWIREAWKVALPKIRNLLPAGWRKLPDWALTTVAVALLVFVLWLTVQLLPGKAPATAKPGDRPPAAIDTPAPEPSSEPVADPALIANIQTQVAEVTDQYAEGLIQAVQADFRNNLLTVKVGDDWYTLDATNQERLANELLKRSNKLDFDTLEITNAEGERLARSPVVGAKMVIY